MASGSDYEDYEEWSEIPPKSPSTIDTLSKLKHEQVQRPKILPKPSFRGRLFPDGKSQTKEMAALTSPEITSPKLLPGTLGATSEEEIGMLNKEISQNQVISGNMCQLEPCEKEYELYCKRCQLLTCYKCSRGQCCTGKKHKTVDFEEYLGHHKQRYEMWKAGKKNQSINLDQEIRALSLRIKAAGQKLANAPLSTVSTCARETLQTIYIELENLEKMNEELRGNVAVIAHYGENLKKLADASFIKLVDKLTISDDYKKCKKFNLGTVDSMETRTVEHITPDASGNVILASTVRSVGIFNTTSTRPTGSVALGGHVTGFDSYKKHIYVAVDQNNSNDKVIVFDEQFIESENWQTKIKICDLTVNNEKVYLASMESTLHVFSIHGTYLYEITEGCGTRLASHPLPDVIITTNHEHDRVSAVNGDTKKILWSAKVDKPWGVTIDEYEAVWVWSEFQQGIAIFDDKGTLKQELEHPKMSGIGDVSCICVKNGKLWIGFEGGLYRFQIGYD
ncbi:uncharacterized protein [Watersipora subatra]|uniref:uncharacterized protein isoform X2 n=1 Tax=Watersipora subatra TaxID=2589382 RepID=UPI00355B869E